MTRPTPSPPRLVDGQALHLALLAALLGLAAFAWMNLGKPVPISFWAAIAFPVAHQIFVWLAWRLEWRSGLTSRWLGFQGYVCVFFILFVGRFVSLVVLGVLDRDSLGLSAWLRFAGASILASAGLYAMYSVARYFGMKRAAGADHFDPAYRTMPLVKGGIFRFTNNGMYVYAFMLFWALAIGFNSAASLVVAAFSHAYIWVHYHATEKPDMQYLYGGDQRAVKND